MRRTALAGLLAATLAAAPSAAAPERQTAPGRGKPIRITFPLPKKGNVAVVRVDIPIRSGRRTSQAALPKLGVALRLVRGRTAGLIGTFRVRRTATRFSLTKTFVLPHVLETDGRLVDPPFRFDTTLFATYSGGLALPGHGSGTVDVYLFDAASGRPLVSPGGAACPPAQCSVTLGAGPRKLSVAVDTLVSHPPPPGAFCSGLGVFSDRDVDLQGFVVNSHTSPFDLSVFGFEPDALADPAAARATVAPTIHNAAVASACKPTSAAARKLKRATRVSRSTSPPPSPPSPPPSPSPFDLFVDATHNHGMGVTNLCFPISTSPAQGNVAGTATMTGPSGAGTREFTTDAGGRATPVFRIDSFGQYSVSVTVRGKTVTKTHTVGSAQGDTSACPRP